MKCNGCGHEFVKSLTRCPRCHRSASNSMSNSATSSTTNSTIRRGRASTDSRLLEFPRKNRYAAPAEAPASVPAWRAELTEKVRAIRSRRSGDTQAGAAVEQLHSVDADKQIGVAVQHQPEPAISYSTNITARKATPRTAPIEQAEIPTPSTRRTSSNIVEAALIRVKRASENASRAALPKIESRKMSGSSQVGFASDRGATAVALEPEPEPEAESKPEPAPSPRPELVHTQIQAQISPTPRIDPVLPERPIIAKAVAAIPEPEPEISSPDIETAVLPFDDIEPVDYLEREIRKVDQAYGASFLRNESPSVFTHVVIFAVDMFAIAASCLPFLAIIRIADGNFSSPQTRMTSYTILALISFFYLVITQGLCGRTFGMMLTNTRIVDSQTFEAPSATRSLVRAAAYFIAAAPAMLGIVWAAFDGRRRGWQDFISGTIVVRDF